MDARRRRVGSVVALVLGVTLASGCFSRVGGTRLFELAAGDCFDDHWVDADDERLILRVDVVDCEQPHEKQVTAIVPVPGDDEYPGRDVFAAIVNDACAAALPQSASDQQRGIVSSGQFPSRNSWDLGYRWVICIARSEGERDLRGSLTGDPSSVEAPHSPVATT